MKLDERMALWINCGPGERLWGRIRCPGRCQWCLSRGSDPFGGASVAVSTGPSTSQRFWTISVQAIECEGPIIITMYQKPHPGRPCSHFIRCRRSVPIFAVFHCQTASSSKTSGGYHHHDSVRLILTTFVHPVNASAVNFTEDAPSVSQVTTSCEIGERGSNDTASDGRKPPQFEY